MTEFQGFSLHPGAARDITRIWEFIAKDNLVAAGRFREQIFHAIRMLVSFPHQGHTRTDLTSRPLRFHSLRDFLSAYAADEKPLLVVGVLHGWRNPRIIAAILRSRD